MPRPVARLARSRLTFSGGLRWFQRRSWLNVFFVLKAIAFLASIHTRQFFSRIVCLFFFFLSL